MSLTFFLIKSWPKMKSKLLIVATIIISIASCKYGDIFKFYKNDIEGFSINYPPYLKKGKHIHPRAPFQARNSYRDIYFIVDVYNKDSIESLFLFDSLKTDLIENITDPYEEYDTTYSYNSFAIQESQISGTIKDERLIFKLAVLEGKQSTFHVCGWMFRSKQPLWMHDIETAIKSIKEL